jgi:hypothetical protein
MKRAGRLGGAFLHFLVTEAAKPIDIDGPERCNSLLLDFLGGLTFDWIFEYSPSH